MTRFVSLEDCTTMNPQISEKRKRKTPKLQDELNINNMEEIIQEGVNLEIPAEDQLPSLAENQLENQVLSTETDEKIVNKTPQQEAIPVQTPVPIIEESRQRAVNPLKIAMLTWESLHSISHGGVAVHVTELACALERKGHEVHVFTRVGWPGQAQYELIHGVHYHRIPYQGHHDIVDDINNMCRAFVTTVFQVEDYMGKHFDIVHAHDWLASNAMVWIKQGRGRKSILTIHSTEYGRSGNNFWGGRSARVRDHERHGTYCADKVISVSHSLKNEIIWMYNLPDWKVCPVYNGINFHHFNIHIDQGGVKQKYCMGPLDPMVLFAGRMAVQKGPDILIEAVPMVLRNYPNAKFVFAGDGHLRGEVEKRAHQLGVSHATRFLGQQNIWTLRELFKACECVCVPSRNEPFGIVILEAWSAGKPVVSTDIGGPSEFVWHNVTGYKIYPNPHSVAWGIGTLFGNFEHARWMGQNGKYAAEKDFSWDVIADHTLGVYYSIL